MAKTRSKRLTDEIREAVERSSMTRYAIAKETGIDAGALCRFIQGKGLSMESLDKLADCLGLHIVAEGESEKGR